MLILILILIASHAALLYLLYEFVLAAQGIRQGPPGPMGPKGDKGDKGESGEYRWATHRD